MSDQRTSPSPTFIEVGAQRPAASRRPTVPAALRWYNPVAVSTYSPTFVDVSVEPDGGKRAMSAPSSPPAVWETLQHQRWQSGLVKGTALAALVGGLVLRHPAPAAASGAGAAPPADPPPPATRRTADDGKLEALVKQIGNDSPLWQVVESGDDSALWRLAERVGPDSELWSRLRQVEPDAALWSRIARLGADSPVWNRLAEEGDAAELMQRIEKMDGEGPTGLRFEGERPSLPRFERESPPWRRVEGEGPSWQRFDAEADGTSPARPDGGGQALEGRTASSRAAPTTFVEWCPERNPLPLQAYDQYYADVPDPTFVDVDGDGDFDAFVGEFQGESPVCGITAQDVRFFENLDVDDDGWIGNPVFVERCGSDNPLPLRDDSQDYSFLPSPDFVDIDGDGDFDAFVGEVYGYSSKCLVDSEDDVRFFENIGSPSEPDFEEGCGPQNPLPLRPGSTFTATLASPTFVDIDGDGDADVFVGEYQGFSPVCGPSEYDVRFFENLDVDGDGELGAPVFEERCGADNPLPLRSGPPYYSLVPSPAFVDVDGDGDFDAFVGETYGYSPVCGHTDSGIRFFENLDVDGDGELGDPVFEERCGAANPLYSGFVYETQRFLGLGAFYGPRPAFVEIDGDGDFDAFVGEKAGYGACGYSEYDVRFFENVGQPIGGVTHPAPAAATVQPWAWLAGLGVVGAAAAAVRRLKRTIT